MNGVCWDFSICFLPADPEDHTCVGGDGGGGAQGLTQPAVRSALIHFNCYLQSGTQKQGIQLIKVINRIFKWLKHKVLSVVLIFKDFLQDHDPD